MLPLHSLALGAGHAGRGPAGGQLGAAVSWGAYATLSGQAETCTLPIPTTETSGSQSISKESAYRPAPHRQGPRVADSLAQSMYPAAEPESSARVSHMENLVGDFGGAPEVPGNNGAIGRVPTRSICAAQKLGAFLEEEDVQGLLDGCLVAPHYLQERVPVTLVGPRNTGRAPTERAREGPPSARGQVGLVGAVLGNTAPMEQPKPRSCGLELGDLSALLSQQANVHLPWELLHGASTAWPHWAPRERLVLSERELRAGLTGQGHSKGITGAHHYWGPILWEHCASEDIT